MKNFLIIGMGEFGKHLAYKLLSLKNEVCIVDTDKELISVLASDFPNAYVANGMLEMTLKDLGIPNYDACIVGVGNNYQASLEITSRLKEEGARYIISKATSEIHAKFLKMAGADETIYPEKDMAEKVAVHCNATHLLDYINIADDYSIYEIKVLSEWVGKTLKYLNIRNRYDINVIAVSNKSGVTIPQADYTFQTDDHVFIIGKDSIMKKIK